jgi:LCP family protein required for cell wall assembly
MRYRSEGRTRRGTDYDEYGERRRPGADRAGHRAEGSRLADRLTGRGAGRPGAYRGDWGSGGGSRSPHWRYRSRLVKAGYATGIFVTVLVVVASLGAYAVYRHLTGNIKSVSVSGLTHRSIYGVQNILLLGSQTRKGQGKGFGSNPSLNTSNSDNLLLVHLDPTHTHAVILSIPRDTIVYEPGCKARPGIGDGTWGPYQAAIVDGAMNIGGPSCAVKTVKDLTGIKLDHFVMFDFNSFRSMVDAIGGVEVCVPRGGYHDKWSRLNLSAGKHLLTYNRALAYVRTRHGVSGDGDVGGDLPRIMLQQAFISSIVQKVNSQGILSNVPQLLKIADIATKALTVDRGLDSVSKLLGLARTLSHLRAKNVSLLTMPTVPDTDPAFSGRLLPEEPQDDVIFQMVTGGQRWRGNLPTEPPGQVKVRVLNGSGITGLAARTARSLRKLGYDVTGFGNATSPEPATTVTYSGTAQADSAYTLMTALKATPAAQNLLAEPVPQTGTPGTISLILGPDFTGVNPPPAKHPSKSGHHKHKAATSGGYGSTGFVQARNAGASICTGLPQANPNSGTPP